MVQGSFRLPQDVKERATFICQQHGVDLSDFLRHCCVGLVRDYTPSKP